MPAGQGLHVAAPGKLYVPAAQITAVLEVDPGGQQYPAEQLPVHNGDVRPVVPPYVPPGHWAVQLAVVRPGEDPYVPDGQGVHVAPALPVL